LAQRIVAEVALGLAQQTASGISTDRIVSAVQTKGGITAAILQDFECNLLQLRIKQGLKAGFTLLENLR